MKLKKYETVNQLYMTLHPGTEYVTNPAQFIVRTMEEKGFNNLPGPLNPDQSVAMFRSFASDFETCGWKGFEPRHTVAFLLAAVKEHPSVYTELKAQILLQSMEDRIMENNK